MTKRNSRGYAGLALAAVFILILMVSGIPGSHSAAKEKCTQRSAVVAEVKNGTPGIVIHLAHDPKIYFISRKNERGLTAAILEKQLEGHNVNMLVADNWSPLDPFSSMLEIEEIKMNEAIIYSNK
ncbi:hypothetical protein [Chitinophaga sp. Cy-1792]|uniref:hypothetical protein n=1 Tax=Chitinophaga sp. Cy-1792 TaxID=2608339 RepID=UPI00142125C6|nr:hypothetical protein [Chitinophaga sp. Cy-1792]NIG53508.1 hypothetical protein [Chitinophaga sp. Cy-1792]